MTEDMARIEAVIAHNTVAIAQTITILAQVQEPLGLPPIPTASIAAAIIVIPHVAPVVIPVPPAALPALPAAHPSAPAHR